MSKDIKAQDVQEALSQEALSKSDPKKIESLSKAIEKNLFKGLDTLDKAKLALRQVVIDLGVMGNLMKYAETSPDVKKIVKELMDATFKVQDKFVSSIGHIHQDLDETWVSKIEKLRIKAVKLANKDVKNQKG